MPSVEPMLRHVNPKWRGDIPAGVRRTQAFFESRGLWYLLSNNLESRSCRDAVQKRYRLGHVGIPLEDELKSFFGKFVADDGSWEFAVFHCRADQDLDMDKLRTLLGANGSVIRLEEEEIKRLFGMEYGLVNPFSTDPHLLQLDAVWQVFDEAVLQSPFAPHTMMTNAGHVEWGIEFQPKELIAAIKKKLVGDITTGKSMAQLAQSVTFGIVTGNSPDSGIKLWQDLNEQIRAKAGTKFLGDLSFPTVKIESIPELGLSMELEYRAGQDWDYVKTAVENLCRSGANAIAVACNTHQFFSDRLIQLCEAHGAKFFSMPEVLDHHLQAHGIATFDFFAISYAADFEHWSGFKDIHSRYEVVLPEKKFIDAINELGYQVKQEGVTGKGINKLRDLINHASRTDTVLIALTELSIMLSTQKKGNRSGKTYIDTLELLAIAMADYFMEKRYPTVE